MPTAGPTGAVWKKAAQTAVEDRNAVEPMGAQPGKRVLELQLPARRDVVYDIRRRLDEFMRGCAAAAEEVEAVKVALSEAATNAICHGSPLGDKNRIRVRFEKLGGELVIEIYDQGQGFRPRAIALPESDEFQPSGRGLWIMEALMDEVAFLPGPEGTCVRLVKRFNTDQSRAAMPPSGTGQSTGGRGRSGMLGNTPAPTYAAGVRE